MRGILRALSAELRHEKALRASRRLIDSGVWHGARAVFVYLSTEREIDTTPLVDAAWRAGKRVLAPKIDAAERAMAPVEIRAWSDCLPGHRGIVEPIDGDPFPAADIDLVIVPGLAFDPRGYRLGKGGGFYDRFLADPRVRGCRCGFAFEEQVVARVPTEPHDQPVHCLITDDRVREFDRPEAAWAGG